jgi:hypothetical protein
VPEPVIVVVLRVAANPVEGVVVRLTVPAKPRNALTVIVAVPDAPASKGEITAGLAVTLKSGPWRIVKPTTTECDKVPEVPVTLAVYEPPEEPEHDRVELPDPPKLLGLTVQERLGELVTLARDTVSVRPFT